MWWCLPGLWTRYVHPYKKAAQARRVDRINVMAPVEIYTTPYCPFCLDAKALLKKKNVAFTEIDVSRDRGLRTKMMQRANGRITVPQIFIGTTHVGGCDELYALEDAGKLDPLLNVPASTGAAP
jgi:glutaredoxin 3